MPPQSPADFISSLVRHVPAGKRPGKLVFKTLSQRWSLAVFALAAMVPIGSLPAASVTINPDGLAGKDAHIVSHIPTSNFGTYGYLTANWGGSIRSIGLVEFDLSSIPAGAEVTSATVGLYHVFNSNLGRRYDMFKITSGWSESTVTFNTAPTIDLSAIASTTINDSLTELYRTWDVTGLVGGWVDGSIANHGVWLEEVPSGSSGTAYFGSSDATAEQRPYLTVVYTVPELSTLSLLATGAGAFAFRRRRTP